MVRMRPRNARMGALTVSAALSLLVAGFAAGDQPDKPCREHPKLIAPCFTVHARMRHYNGAPSVRLWPIGTDRLIGVSEGRFQVAGYQNLPRPFRATLDDQQEIYADFVVCPFTLDEPGVMRLVCVDSAMNIVTKPVAAW